MIKWLEDIKELLKKGFTISYSDGKPFDPYNQERTTPEEDFLKKKREEEVKK